MTEATAPAEEGQVEDTAPADAGQAKEEVMWYNEASDEQKGYVQNKGWDSPLKAVEAYQNLEKFQGVPAEQLLKLPKDGEPMDEVYARLGRPEAADKYEVKMPDGVGEVDAGRISSAQEAAFAAGLSADQFQAMIEYQIASEQGAVAGFEEAQQQQQTIELEALQKEWGNGFEERAELGRRFVRENLPADVDKVEMLSKIEAAIGTAATLKLFANAGSKAGEDRVPDSSGDRPFGYTPEQAVADKAALMSELKGDAERLATFNKGIGPDYDKMQRILKIQAGG